jgi:hypothetical protein
MTVTIINFSHPLFENRPDVLALVGDDYRVIDVRVQVDQSVSWLIKEVDPLVSQAVETAGNLRNIDCIVLPGLASVAVLLALEFMSRGYMPHILRLAPVAGATPPRFEAVELIRGLRWLDAAEGLATGNGYVFVAEER